MHHSKIAKQMPQKCKSFSGSKNETADLYLQYGRTTEALALFRQIGDAQLIAHCLLIHVRTKLRIDPDGSAMYISNEITWNKFFMPKITLRKFNSFSNVE
jgi:hypothetical protein